MKFRKKPVVIEAVQLLWSTWSEMCDFADVGKLTDGKPEGTNRDMEGQQMGGFVGDGDCDGDRDGPGLLIPTLEGLMLGKPGDWIIKGIDGELYPCKPDIFEATYEAVEK